MLGYNTYLFQGARADARFLNGSIFKFLHIQCDIHVACLLAYYFILYPVSLHCLLSEWVIPVMPFKIFENIIFKVLVLFRSSGIRNTEKHFLIL